MRKTLSLLIFLTIACCFALGSGPAFALPVNGRAAPGISAKDLVSGETVSLLDYRGKWVVLQFWSSWCDVCIEHLPQLRAIAARPARENVAVLSVSQDHEQAPMDLYDLLSASPPNFPVLHAYDGEYAKDFGWDVEYVPTTAIIDPRGRVVYSSAGVEDIAAALDFFKGLGELDGAYRLEVSQRLLPDGSLELVAEVESPQGLPLELDFSAWRSRPEEYGDPLEAEAPAEELVADSEAGSAEDSAADLENAGAAAAPVEIEALDAEAAADELSESINLEFSAAKVARQSFVLPADYLGRAADVYYSVDFRIPDSAALNEGFGILLEASSTLYPGLDWDAEATAPADDDAVLAEEEAAAEVEAAEAGDAEEAEAEEAESESEDEDSAAPETDPGEEAQADQP